MLSSRMLTLHLKKDNLKSSMIENEETDERGRYGDKINFQISEKLLYTQKYAKVVCFYQKETALQRQHLAMEPRIFLDCVSQFMSICSKKVISINQNVFLKS